MHCAALTVPQARRAREDFLHMLKHMRDVKADTAWEAAVEICKVSVYPSVVGVMFNGDTAWEAAALFQSRSGTWGGGRVAAAACPVCYF